VQLWVLLAVTGGYFNNAKSEYSLVNSRYYKYVVVKTVQLAVDITMVLKVNKAMLAVEIRMKQSGVQVQLSVENSIKYTDMPAL